MKFVYFIANIGIGIFCLLVSMLYLMLSPFYFVISFFRWMLCSEVFSEFGDIPIYWKDNLVEIWEDRF